MHFASLMVLSAAASGVQNNASMAAEGPSSQSTPSRAIGEKDIKLAPAQLFDLAEQAAQRGDDALAEKLLRALATNPDVQTRSEARFRLAMMLAKKEHKLRDAATLLRQILDEKPRSARVRIELAEIQAELGNMAAASVELRAAQAAGLPPEVERDVRFFMQALDAHRHLGASFEATLMPDSNANRATGAGTVDTLLGNLALSPDAQQRSGLGGNLRGQAYVKAVVSDEAKVLAQMSGAATVFGNSHFDDITLSPVIGPELTFRRDRLTVLVGPAWRWYSMRPYTETLTANATWQHALDRRTQLRADAGFGAVTNRLDPDESGNMWSLGLGVDHAFTARTGGGIQLGAFRQTALLPAWAYTGGSGAAHVFREIGPVTLLAKVTYSHLEADERLVLFSHRRIDNAGSVVISATLRNVRVANVSPILRIRYEKSYSTVDIYNYDRLSGEIGLAASF